MKHIAFRSGSLRMGGLERVLIEVLKGLPKDKYKITLFIEGISDNDVFVKDVPEEVELLFLKSQKLVEYVKGVRNKKSKLFYKLLHNILLNYEVFVSSKALRRYLNERPEIGLLVDFDSGLSKTIHKFPNLKRIAWVHNSIPKLKKKPGKIKRFGRRLENYDVIVAICDDMKKELEAIYPNIKGKVQRIYNPFDFEMIKAQSKNSQGLSIEEKGYLQGDYIIAVSRLDSLQKDYKTLISAYSRAVKEGFSYKLYIVGGGQAKLDIEEQIKAEGQEENIILLGLKKNPYIWMKNAKFFVHSSKYEGLPTVLIEAMICGKAIVSSDCPTGPREILADGRVGKLVGVGDIEGYKRAVLDMQKEYRNYEAKIKGRIIEFKEEKVIKEIDKLISN